MAADNAGAIAVRAVRREDHAQWLALWHAYNVFYGRSWGPNGEPPVEPAVTAAAWARVFDDEQPLWALVAAEEDARGGDGQLLGFTHYLFHLGTNFVAPLCYLEDLFTVETARGRGIGRALIEAVCDAAKAAGAARVYWQTHESNATARRLYDRVAERPGFIIYQRDL